MDTTTIDATARRLTEMGLQPHQVERHVAGLRAAAKYRAAPRTRPG